MSQRRFRSCSPWLPAVLTAAVVATVGVVGVPAPAMAADFSVINAADDGTGSLRQAIADANAAPGPDVVTIAPGLGTITVASPITITDAVTILGNGVTITRATDIDLLVIELVIPGEVVLDSLAFVGDWSTEGGSVVARSVGPDTVTIRGCRFSGLRSLDGSTVGVTTGSITVTDSVFEDLWTFTRGGAIGLGTAVGTSVIATTVFDDNYSAGFGPDSLVFGRGGAAVSVDSVAPDASFTITQSYFHSNQAGLDRWEPTRGFAVHVGEIAGEFVVDSSTFEQQEVRWPDSEPESPSGWSVGAQSIRPGGTMRIVNSTFDEPSFGTPATMDEYYVVSVGSVDPGAAFSMEHSTVVGGGTLVISSNRGSSLVRSTIAEGLAAVDALRVLDGEPVAVEWSVVSTPHAPAFAHDGPGNQWNVGDMMLAPLGDNGGPTTTMMIGPIGPAVGTGMPTALPTEPTLEQRGSGFLRRLGAPDIGAVELPGELPTLPLPTSTPSPTPTPTFNPPTLPVPVEASPAVPAGLAETGSTIGLGPLWASLGIVGLGLALVLTRWRRMPR